MKLAALVVFTLSAAHLFRDLAALYPRQARRARWVALVLNLVASTVLLVGLAQ